MITHRSHTQLGSSSITSREHRLLKIASLVDTSKFKNGIQSNQSSSIKSDRNSPYASANKDNGMIIQHLSLRILDYLQRINQDLLEYVRIYVGKDQKNFSGIFSLINELKQKVKVALSNNFNA